MNIFSVRNFWLFSLLLLVSSEVFAGWQTHSRLCDWDAYQEGRCTAVCNTGNSKPYRISELYSGAWCYVYTPAGDEPDSPCDSGSSWNQSSFSCSDPNSDNNNDGHPDSSSKDEDADPDGDGEPNKTDSDDDGDGVPDVDDPSPTAVQRHFDGLTAPDSYVDKDGYTHERTGREVCDGNGCTAAYERVDKNPDFDPENPYPYLEPGEPEPPSPNEFPPNDVTDDHYERIDTPDGPIEVTTESSVKFDSEGKKNIETTTRTNPDGSKTVTTTTSTSNGEKTTTIVQRDTYIPDGTLSERAITGRTVDHKDGDGNGKDDAEEDKEESSVTGGGNCDSPPSCNGDAVDCAVLASSWRSRCNKDQQFSDAPDCETPPTCVNDPIACGIAKEQWKFRCVFDFDKQKSLDDFTAGLDSVDQNNDGVIDGLEASELDIGSVANVSGIFNSSDIFSSSCPAPRQLSFRSGSQSFDWQPLCDVATGIRLLVIAIGAFISGLILFRGLTN